MHVLSCGGCKGQELDIHHSNMCGCERNMPQWDTDYPETVYSGKSRPRVIDLAIMHGCGCDC
jgi:hypothetical protein